MDTIIPLFPLQVVVYPNSFYPLHVFEERYKKLVLHALRYNTSFGISPLLEKKITPVGTVVKVVEKVNTYANGEFDIIVQGIRRYKITKWWMHDIGYAEALIKFIDDEYFDGTTEIHTALEYKFKETLEKVKLTLDNKFWNNFAETNSKSFKVAEKSGLNLEQQVKLLECKKESARVSMLLEHFNQIIVMQDQKQAAMKIAMNDGYINR